MKVTQLINDKGNPVANHFVISTASGMYLQSYDSIVAFKPHDMFGKLVLGNDWDFSATTLKHVKLFLGWNGCTKKGIQKLLDRGLFEVKDLQAELSEQEAA